MAGAGYDVSLAASDSKAFGQNTFAGTYFAFSGSTLSGGQNSQSAKPVSDAAATNRSPGTTNTLTTPDDSSPLDSYLATKNPATSAKIPTSGNTLLYVGLGIVLIIVLFKK